MDLVTQSSQPYLFQKVGGFFFFQAKGGNSGSYPTYTFVAGHVKVIHKYMGFKLLASKLPRTGSIQ